MEPVQLRHTETRSKEESSNMDVAAKIFQIIPDPTFVVHIQEKHDVQNQALADLILQDLKHNRDAET